MMYSVWDLCSMASIQKKLCFYTYRQVHRKNSSTKHKTDSHTLSHFIKLNSYILVKRPSSFNTIIIRVDSVGEYDFCLGNGLKHVKPVA